MNVLARYSCAPREGHFRALQRTFGYLRDRSKGKILIDENTAPIDEKVQPNSGQLWSEMYPDACEDIPRDAPEPRGKTARITAYVDADHARDKVTCRSVTGVLLLINNTPLQWLSKRQPTVEVSTYGSELIATRIAVDMILEVRYKLRMLGVPLKKASLLVGDNMSVVLNTTIPSSPLKKKHLGCAYHRVRETIAAGIIEYGHVESKENIADIFTKPLPIPQFRQLADRYLFRRPRTSTLEEYREKQPDKMIEGE